MIKGLEYLPYEGRLHQLGLFSLGKKEAKGTHDRGVQNLHGMENVGRETFFSLSHNTRTRGHPMKL